MKTPPSEPIGRGVLGIVVTGILLGLAFNQLGRTSHPSRGLPWIAEKVELASLETQAAKPEAAPPPAPAPTKTIAPRQRADRWGPPRGALAADTGSRLLQVPDRGRPPEGTPAADSHSGLPDVPDLDRPLKVEAETVKKFFDAHAALIIDARDAEEFEEGHIPGALNLPYDQVGNDPERLSNVDSRGMPIIVYCDGGACELSMNLAENLIRLASKRKVLVYSGGWSDWTEKKLPVAKGKAG